MGSTKLSAVLEKRRKRLSRITAGRMESPLADAGELDEDSMTETSWMLAAMELPVSVTNKPTTSKSCFVGRSLFIKFIKLIR